MYGTPLPSAGAQHWGVCVGQGPLAPQGTSVAEITLPAFNCHTVGVELALFSSPLLLPVPTWLFLYIFLVIAVLFASLQVAPKGDCSII